jgi:hypothetical protein
VQLFKTRACNEIRNVVVNILYACVIMHNVIIKDKDNARLEDYFNAITIPIRRDLTIDKYTHGSKEIENANVHYRLHNGFIKHLWL